MFAIVSDIHGNLEAFNAVLAEIERREIQHIVCLGDIVGYGPNPMECLDLVASRCRAAIMGNHDFAVLYEPFNFNSGAEAACFWTRKAFEILQNDRFGGLIGRRYWRAIGLVVERARSVLQDGFGGTASGRRQILQQRDASFNIEDGHSAIQVFSLKLCGARKSVVGMLRCGLARCMAGHDCRIT